MKNKKQNLLNLLANNKISIIAEDVSTEPLEINSSISNIEIDNIASNYVIDNYIYHLSAGEDVYCFDFNSKKEIESEDFVVIDEYRDQDHYPDLTEEEFEYYQQLTVIAEKLGLEKKHEIKENLIKTII